MDRTKTDTEMVLSCMMVPTACCHFTLSLVVTLHYNLLSLQIITCCLSKPSRVVASHYHLSSLHTIIGLHSTRSTELGPETAVNMMLSVDSGWESVGQALQVCGHATAGSSSLL